MSESTDDRLEPIPHEADNRQSVDDWGRRTEESRALIARLTDRVRRRDRRIALLELALTRTVLMNHVWASHLERKLERSSFRNERKQSDCDDQRGASMCDSTVDKPVDGVTVHLPHLTRTLEALFDVMHEFWAEWDPERPPKSSTVARVIDEKLGLKAQANGEASRSAQTFAAALRPESTSESEGRHR